MNIEIVLLLFAVGMVGVGSLLSYFLSKEIKIAKNEELTEKLNFYKDLLLKTVDIKVEEMNQKVVDELKRDNDGKLSKEDAAKIFETVKKDVLQTISEEGKSILQEAIKDLPFFVSMAIEAAVRKNK